MSSRWCARSPFKIFFTTVREVGVGDSLELLELMSPEQVQGFLDLDAWRRDRIDPAAAANWLEAFQAADADRAVRQVLGLDVELLTLLLKANTQVYDLSLEEDAPGDPPITTITPDHRFLVVFDPAQEKLATILKRTLEKMYGVDMPRVLRLMEAIRWELPSSLEEECYRWRNARMADLGFLPPEDALEVFAFVDPDKAPTLPPVEVPTSGAPDLSTSVVLRDELVGEGALKVALERSSAEVQKRVRHELVLVANRVHVALGRDPGDPAALRDSLKQVAATIGVGLSYLAKGDASQLTVQLTSRASLRLFQIGHSVGVRLSRELRARMKTPGAGLAGEQVLRLDAPLREVVAGVLKARPLFFAGLTDPARVDFVPFRSLEDIAHAAAAITEAAFRAALVGEKGLGADDKSLADVGIYDAATGPSHGALLGTWLARAALALPSGFGPLTPDEVSQLAEVGDLAKARPALEAAATQAAPLPGAPDDAVARQRAWAYAERVAEQVFADIKSDFPRTIYTTMWADEQLASLDAE